MESLDTEKESDEECREIPDTVEDIIANIFNVDDHIYGSGDEDGEVLDNHVFSYLASAEDKDYTVSFTARLHDSAFSHGVCAKRPHGSFNGNFEGVMVDTGAARGNITGSVKYQEY